MKLLLTGIVFACLCLLPQLGELYDFVVPLRGIITIPATGLDYLCIFFHEIGHTIFRWSFGYPALPSFDFSHGGGMTYGFERTKIVLFAFYALATAAFSWCMAKREYWLAAGVSALTGLHLLLAFNDRHEILCAYMGHGAEIIVGAFCIVRAARGETVGGAVEQYLNMVFGLFALGRNLLMAWGLRMDANARDAYAMQKGGHLMGDFDQISALGSWRIESVATFSFVLTALALLAALALAVFLPKRARLGQL